MSLYYGIKDGGFMVSAVSYSARAPIAMERAQATQPAGLITVSGAAKVVAGALLFAGATAGTGRLLQLGGSQLIAHSPAFQEAGRAALIAGDKLLAVGKGAFLSVSVPIYTVTWTAPKWIATKGAPKAATFFHHYVLLPASKKLAAATLLFQEAMMKAAQAFYTFALQPFGRSVVQIGSRVLNAIVIPCLEAMIKAIQAIQVSILEPLANALVHVVQKAWTAVVPKLGLCKKAIERIVSQILKPLGEFLARILHVVWNVAIQSLDAAKKAIQTIFHQLLKPLIELKAKAAAKLWTAILPMLEASKNAIAKAALAFYNAILAPVSQALNGASKWIWEVAIIPTAQNAAQFAHALKILVEKVVSAIHQNALMPLGKLVGDAAVQAMEATSEACALASKILKST